MKMGAYKLLFLFFISILYQNWAYTQEISTIDIDSLIQLDFEELYQEILTSKKKVLSRSKLFTKAYLQKAKNLDSVSEMSRGFHQMASFHKQDYEKFIIYIDSALAVVKNTSHVLQTGSLYLYKGVRTQKKGYYAKALDCYLKGLEHSKKNDVSVYKSIFQIKIASLKRELGKYEEAKSLYKQCLQYEKTQIGRKKNDSIRYLWVLSDLISTYRLNKEIDSSYYFFEQGNKMSQNTDIESIYILNRGVLQYYKKNYNNAIVLINKFLESKYELDYGEHNLIDAYLYLGKSHLSLNQKKIAIKYFKKIDTIVQKSDRLIWASRPAYLEIIDYYKLKNDKGNQLLYINRLLHNDSIFHGRYKSTSEKLNKEFDTPILLFEKEELINELKAKNNWSYYGLILSIILILIIASVLLISYKKNKRYRKRFDELMNSSEEKIIDKRTEDELEEKSSSIGISEDVVELILKGLDDFEQNNGFLQINITSAILAKRMNTNSKYLTKVIKFYRNKNFTSYINDLRVDYIIKRLKKDKKIQNYTIKALAVEAGFNSAEVFSKSFYKNTGIYPSYFIKKIQNIEN